MGCLAPKHHGWVLMAQNFFSVSNPTLLSEGLHIFREAASSYLVDAQEVVLEHFGCLLTMFSVLDSEKQYDYLLGRAPKDLGERIVMHTY